MRKADEDYLSTVLLGWRTEEMKKSLCLSNHDQLFFPFSELCIESVQPLIKHQVRGKAASLLRYFSTTNKKDKDCFVT